MHTKMGERRRKKKNKQKSVRESRGVSVDTDKRSNKKMVSGAQSSYWAGVRLIVMIAWNMAANAVNAYRNKHTTARDNCYL